MKPFAKGPKRILLVDDEGDLRMLLKNCLSAFGHRVVAEADNGWTAAELFEAHKPDLVLTDLEMPDGDGWVTLEEVRKIDPQAIVVFLTGAPGEGLKEKARAKGASGFLTKPFRVDRVQQEIQSVLAFAAVQRAQASVSEEYMRDWLGPRRSFGEKSKGPEDEENSRTPKAKGEDTGGGPAS